MSKPATEIAFLLIPRFNMLALTAAIEPLRIANYLSAEPVYAWRFLSEHGGRILASNGFDVETAPVAECRAGPEIVVACASWGAEHHEAPALSRWLRRMRRGGARLAAMDLGIYLLARAGLLEGHRVTIHWSCLAGFAERFPQADVVEQLFTDEGSLMTVGGGGAGTDLMLHLIAERHGAQLASEVADQMLHFPVREATTPQRRTLGGLRAETHAQVRRAIALMEANKAEPLSVPSLAEAVGTSQRQLERLFQQDMGCSVVRFNLILRLQSARVLLTSTGLSIREVSAASGFNSLSYFGKMFAKAFGRRPSEYREAWPDSEPAPAWPGTVFDFRERARAAPAKGRADGVGTGSAGTRGRARG